MRSPTRIILIFFIVLILLILSLFIFSRTAHAPSNVIRPRSSPTPAQIANPASVYCEKIGGKLTIEKNNLGEYGLCNFLDGRACEEWALFRGDCPKGGVKTTGYDTTAEKYCAWLGGKTLAVKNAICTLPNGKICDDEALYNGSCSPNK